MIQQLSIFIENRPGTLHDTLETIKSEHLQIIASTISDTTEYGIYRVIAAEPEKAYEALKADGLMVRVSDVFAISLKNVPGTAADTISLFTEAGLNIEYVYSFTWQNNGILIMRTNDEKLTQKIISDNKLVCIEESELQF